jgi:DNA-binding MarR family transcriptional regulator
MTGLIDPATVAWLRLARIYHRIDQRSADTMKGFGLSVSRFDVLNHAGTPEGRTQQELAAALLVTKGNVTQLLDGLEQDGLIERRRDGRAKRIFLTDRGRDLRQNAVTAQEAAIAEDFAVLDPDERRQLVTLLRKVERRLADRS